MAVIDVKIDPGSADDLRAVVDDDALERWLKEIVLEAQNICVREMHKGGKGRVYIRRGKAHRASAPGDYPAVDTGRLSASTRIAVKYPRGEIGSNVPYAKFMLGTKYIAPRRLYADALHESLKKKPAPDGYVGWVIGGQ